MSWAQLAGSKPNSKSSSAKKEAKEAFEDWAYVTVEWWGVSRVDEWTIQEAAKLARAQGGSLVRLRSDVHATTYGGGRNPVTREKEVIVDPLGDHFTCEIKLKSGFWSSYHLYTENKINEKGNTYKVKNSNVQPNPRKWAGTTSICERNGMQMRGSRKVKLSINQEI